MFSLTDVSIIVNEEIDAAIDASDHAYGMGKEDATEGRRQDAFPFAADAASFAAYSEGYRDGAIVAAILAGQPARYWDPECPTEIQMVSWANQPMGERPGGSRSPIAGQFKCPSCGTYYDPTYGNCPGCGGYVPFQQEPAAYGDIYVAEYREDWVGA